MRRTTVLVPATATTGTRYRADVHVAAGSPALDAGTAVPGIGAFEHRPRKR